MTAEVVFFPKKSRERLAEIDNSRPTPELLKEREEILASKKGLQQMTIAECQAMKLEINQKIAKIAAIGRTEHTRSFLLMLQQLDERIYTLMMNAAKRESVDAIAIRTKQKNSKSNPLARTRRSRWASTIPTGNTDSDKSVYP